MPGGYLQLKNRGKEDIHFTVKPDISYYRYCYLKYRNFFKFPISAPFSDSDRKNAINSEQV